MFTIKAHGYWDYFTAFFFLIAPLLFPLSENGSSFSYFLGTLHLVMTIFTNFPLGLVKIIPFKFHEYVELVISLLLLIVPWLLVTVFSGLDKIFYMICGAVIFAVWFISYEDTVSQEKAD